MTDQPLSAKDSEIIFSLFAAEKARIWDEGYKARQDDEQNQPYSDTPEAATWEGTRNPYVPAAQPVDTGLAPVERCQTYVAPIDIPWPDPRPNRTDPYAGDYLASLSQWSTTRCEACGQTWNGHKNIGPGWVERSNAARVGRASNNPDLWR